jgi:YD repeat-containing protein
VNPCRPLPPYRILTGLADCFGRTLAFHRDLDGIFTGNITAVTDGAGRRFRLTLTSQAQRAATAHKQTDSSGVSARIIRRQCHSPAMVKTTVFALKQVWLTLDPDPENLPALPLARYTYTPRGELSAVYDHSGTQVRSFIYDDNHPGRMTAHQHAGRPQITYGYDASGLVVEQHNPAGLSYRYEYKKHAVVITDCLNRREVLHTEGQGGLKRIVRKKKPTAV